MSQAAANLLGKLEGILAERDRAAFVKVTQAAVEDGELAIDELYRDVFTPLLAGIGGRWQEGSTRIWEEHFASSCVRTAIESLYLEVSAVSRYATPLNKTVLLACPAGELHDLGLRMLADRMQIEGWRTYFLGADTPTQEIIAAARDLEADLVALSAATHYNRMLLRAVLDELKAALPQTRIGVGGPAFVGDPDWPQDEVLTDCNLGIVHDGSCEA